jgi:hydroxyacylglutathione hydrolase
MPSCEHERTLDLRDPRVDDLAAASFDARIDPGTSPYSDDGGRPGSMMVPDWLRVVERPFPSSTLVAVDGSCPIVVDPGSANDVDVLPDLLEEIGIADTEVAAVVCSHYHADHVGAVALLQRAGAVVAAHPWDAAMVNARDRDVCAARWLDQPVLPYRVDRTLPEGETVTSGDVELQVLHTPGHTLGGISLWEPDSRILICGDALHARDTPWVGCPHEGSDAVQRALLTLDRIEALEPLLVASGHGPPFEDVATAIERARRRFGSWLEDPAVGVMYAAKRIFTYRLMLEPIPRGDVRSYLRTVRWMRDLAASIEITADALAEQLLDELAPSLNVDGDRMETTAPHRSASVRAPWLLADPLRWSEWPQGQ